MNVAVRPAASDRRLGSKHSNSSRIVDLRSIFAFFCNQALNLPAVFLT
jgi:hypothetical protein